MEYIWGNIIYWLCCCKKVALQDQNIWKKGIFHRKELQYMASLSLRDRDVCVWENVGILGNTRSSYRRNEGMTAAERYIIWHFQINRSAVCYSPSLIAITQLWFKTQPVHGSCYSCCSKHTMFDWSLAGHMHWLTDRDVIYSTVPLCLFVLNRKMSCDSHRGWAGKERRAPPIKTLHLKTNNFAVPLLLMVISGKCSAETSHQWLLLRQIFLKAKPHLCITWQNLRDLELRSQLFTKVNSSCMRAAPCLSHKL